VTMESFLTKKARARFTGVCLGIACVATVSLAIPFAGAANAVSPHVVTLSAAGPYSNSQQITITVAANSTFTPGSGIKVLECSDPGGSSANLPTSAASCDGNTIQGNTVIVGAGGTISVTGYTLYQLPSAALSEGASSQPVCSTTAFCVLYVGQNQNDFTQPFLFSAPFVFSGSSAPPTTAPPTTTPGSPPTTSPPTTQSPAGAQGLWVANSGGEVSAGGAFTNLGDLTGVSLAKPIVGIAATPDNKGYWMVATDGGIFSEGDAGFFGSTGNIALNKPVVGMAATPDGKGYWLVASDGGIFSEGDAQFFGSAGSSALAAPIVGMARTSDGGGYWFVGSDGSVYPFGDAGALGSATGGTLPVVGITS
jgi:hypothetical protein